MFEIPTPTARSRRQIVAKGQLRSCGYKSARTFALITVFLVAPSCLGNSVGPEGVVPIAGTWTYTAQQSSGGVGSSAGTISIDSESQTTYSGTLDVLETLVGMTSRRVAGPLSGRLISGSSVDFDVTLGTVHRQHIGALHGDTISGSWFEMSGGSVSSDGTYRAVRAR